MSTNQKEENPNRKNIPPARWAPNVPKRLCVFTTWPVLFQKRGSAGWYEKRLTLRMSATRKKMIPHTSLRMGSMGLFDLDTFFVFLLNELLPQFISSDLHSYPLWVHCVQKKMSGQTVKRRIADYGYNLVLHRDNDR